MCGAGEDEHANRCYVGASEVEASADWTDLVYASGICVESRLGMITPTFVMANYVARVAKLPLKLFSLAGHEAGAATYSDALDPATKFVTDGLGSRARRLRSPTLPIRMPLRLRAERC